MKDTTQKFHAMRIILPAIVVLILLSIVHVSAIDITATGDISIPLNPSTSPNSAPGTLTVSSTNPTGWTVKVVDAEDHNKAGDGHWDGHLTEYTTGTTTYGPHYLAANMTVHGSSSPPVTDAPAVTLTGTANPQTLESASGPTSTTVSLTFQQAVAYTDTVLTNGNNYQIVVEFDAFDN